MIVGRTRWNREVTWVMFVNDYIILARLRQSHSHNCVENDDLDFSLTVPHSCFFAIPQRQTISFF